ncbi:protein BNIP5 [Hippopotamus amphibius kiboko]|uniref:protein BNIP5 n=1 Tax=Hippopotamus amphibius kiboko TaxID=575201 RepID=UPI00259A8343|nr:protein BNIP5 [Hippopotamus amphibius kiboko]
MEPPQGPRKPLSGRRARSLDRPQNPRKDSESWDCKCISRPTIPSWRMLHRTASDGARCPKSPAQSAEAQGTRAVALSPEETREFLPSEQRPLQDAKKDKAQWRAQQGWLRAIMNFFFGTDPEEPKEKTNKRAKGKEGLPEPAETPETPGEPAPRKKAHSKKASRKKHSHKKHGAEETRGARDQEAEGQEDKIAGASCCKEAHLGPAAGGGDVSELHQLLLLEGGGAGVWKVSSQAAGHQWEEELRKPGKDTIIQKIVELLQKVGDQWEEEQHQASQPGAAPQSPPVLLRRKSQERKSSFKRTFSHKKHGSEEPKRGGAADVSSPESRPPKRPSFLPLCVGGHRPSSSSSPGVEEPEFQEVLSTDGGDPSPFELSNPAGSQGPEEDLQLDRASEFKFIQKIITLLQDAEEQGGDKQLQVQDPEVVVETLAPACRKKSQEKKSSFRKAFSHKKSGFKEPKRERAAGATSPQSRPPKRPSFLPLCVGGHRPSISSNPDLEDLEFQESSPAEGGAVGSSEAPSQARSHKPEAGPQLDGAMESKELTIQKLVALLQEVDGQLGEQMRRHPSFKKFFYKLSDSSLRKLVATLHSQEAHSTEPKRPCPFVFGLANKCAGNNFHTVLSLSGLHYRRPSYGQFPYGEAQQNITSPQSQSPD